MRKYDFNIANEDDLMIKKAPFVWEYFPSSVNDLLWLIFLIIKQCNQYVWDFEKWVSKVQ